MSVNPYMIVSLLLRVGTLNPLDILPISQPINIAVKFHSAIVGGCFMVYRFDKFCTSIIYRSRQSHFFPAMYHRDSFDHPRGSTPNRVVIVPNDSCSVELSYYLGSQSSLHGCRLSRNVLSKSKKCFHSLDAFV